MGRPITCDCGTCSTCRRRQKAAGERELLQRVRIGTLALPASSNGASVVESSSSAPPPPPTWSPPAPEPEPELGAARRVEPVIDVGDEFIDETPPEIDAGPDPGPAEQDAWSQHMNARIAQLGAFGEAMAQVLTGIVARNLDVCEEHGMPLPKLSSRPEDAESRRVALELYYQSALYTLALLPIRPGKYTPVVVTVGGLAGTGVAAGVARRRAADAPAENAPRPAETEQPAPAPMRTRRAPARPPAAAGDDSVPFNWSPPAEDAA